jgi:hypothetical protein
LLPVNGWAIVALGVTLLSSNLRAQDAKPAEVTAPKHDDTRAYFEVLRSKYNVDKVATLNDVLKLSATEADKFWPIYREYEQELADLGDRKLNLIREFLSYHSKGTLTDEKAKSLSKQWLDNLQARTDLWKKYNDKFSETLSPIRAAQFTQIENRVGMVVDLLLASELPLVRKSAP